MHRSKPQTRPNNLRLVEKKQLPKKGLPKKQSQDSTEQISRLLVTVDETPALVPERKSGQNAQPFPDGIHAVELINTVYKQVISVTGHGQVLFEFPLSSAGSGFTNCVTVVPGSQNHIAYTNAGSIEHRMVDFKNKKMVNVWRSDSYDPSLRFSGKIHISEDQYYWAVDLRGPNSGPTILHMRKNCYRTVIFLFDCSDEGLKHGKWIDSRFCYIRHDHSVCVYDPRTHFKFVYGAHISAVRNPIGSGRYLFTEEKKSNNEKRNQALVSLGGNQANEKMIAQIKALTSFHFFVARIIQQYASIELTPELPFPSCFPTNIRVMLNQAYSALDKSNQPEPILLRKAYIEELVRTIPSRKKFSASEFRSSALELLKKYEKIRGEMTEIINEIVPPSRKALGLN